MHRPVSSVFHVLDVLDAVYAFRQLSIINDGLLACIHKRHSSTAHWLDAYYQTNDCRIYDMKQSVSGMFSKTAIHRSRRVTASAVVIHIAATRPAVPSVNSRPSLVSCRCLYLLEHSAWWRAICTICFFLSATAKDIPVSSVISWHYPLNFCTTLPWTSQQLRLFKPR